MFRGAGRGGRGAYYKNLYGRGGKGRGSEDQSSQSQDPSNEAPSPTDDILSRGPAPLGRVLGNRDFFERELNRIDGKSYGAYKDLKGIDLFPSSAKFRGVGFRNISSVTR
jgi:hypothetical protein